MICPWTLRCSRRRDLIRADDAAPYCSHTVDSATVRRSRFAIPLALVSIIGFTGSLIAAPGGFDPDAVYRTRCTGCHTYGHGIKVGPDLEGVTRRRDRAWLVRFIRSSEDLIRSKDPTAIALFEQFKRQRMPDWSDLSPQQIEQLLDYLDAGGPERKPSDERHAKDATAAEIEKGRRIFTGRTPLRTGYAACISCHSAGNGRSLSGGTFARDLTNVYLKYQDKALTTFLRYPCYAAKVKKRQRRFLAPDELFAIKAYLRNTAQTRARLADVATARNRIASIPTEGK